MNSGLKILNEYFTCYTYFHLVDDDISKMSKTALEIWMNSGLAILDEYFT